MLNVLNFLTAVLFVLVVSVTPYATAKGAAVSFAENPEDSTSTNSNFKEEIHHSGIPAIFIHLIAFDCSFPHYLDLKPQYVVNDVLKPPLS